MSDTALAIDAAQELANWCRRVAGMYVKDLRALSDEGFAKPFGSKTRSAQDFSAEVAGFNGMVASIIGGEKFEMPSDERRAAYTASLDTRDKAIAAVQASAEALAKAIETGGDNLTVMTQAPWGEPLSVFQLATIAVNHMMYHDGQLNFLQSLHGDDQIHWMDA